LPPKSNHAPPAEIVDDGAKCVCVCFFFLKKVNFRACSRACVRHGRGVAGARRLERGAGCAGRRTTAAQAGARPRPTRVARPTVTK
jgi:hypothetical protein